MKIRLLSQIHFLVKFNPFNLERKFIEKNEVDFIKILGGKCIPHELLEFINQKEIFMKLNKLFLKYTTANDITKKFIENDPKNIDILKQYFKGNALKYQYVYATLSHRYFCRVDKYVKRSLTIYLMKKFNQTSILVSLQLLKRSKKMLKL